MIYLALYLMTLMILSAAFVRRLSRGRRRVMRLNHYYQTEMSRSRAHAQPRFERCQASYPDPLATAQRVREVGRAQAGLLRLDTPLPKAMPLRQTG